MNPADDGFSSGCWIGSENDDCPIPNIELGVASGMVAISYSSSSDTLRQLDPVLRVFRRHGYVAYDPQADALVQDADDLSQADARFASTKSDVVSRLQSDGETVVGQPTKKPWWRFW